LGDLLGRLSFSASRVDRMAPSVKKAYNLSFVREFFGPENAPLAWFSLGGTGGLSRGEIAESLATRPFRHADFRLVQVGPMWWVEERANVALGLIIFDVQHPRSGKRLGYGTGKGEYHCSTGSFEVLSLAIHSERPALWPAELTGGAAL